MDKHFPTRSYPYRRRSAGALESTDPRDVALTPRTLYRFVLGLDPAPRPMTAEEIATLGDPFAATLLRRDVFPMTLRALMAALDAVPADAGLLPAQESYMVGDGGKIPWSAETATLERNLRFVVIRCRRVGADADVMVSTSTRIDAPETFLQVIGWDDSAGLFNYYERRGGTWIWAGNSWHALEDGTRGRGPFDSHVNGAVVMKELTVPWLHWHSQSASITTSALAPDDPVRTEALWLERKGAERFENLVARAGVRRWTASRMRRVTDVDGTVQKLPQLLRQVLDTTTVNLACSTAESASAATRKEPLQFPLGFFVNHVALFDAVGLEVDAPPMLVDGARYARLRIQVGTRLTDGGAFTREGETFFAFVVPTASLEDLTVLDALLAREVLSPRLAACLLMVDAWNPVYSARRRALMRYVPDTAKAGAQGADLDRRLGDAIVAGATTPDGPEAEFAALWAHEDDWRERFAARVGAYLDGAAKRLDGDDGVLDALRLAEGRRRRFRDSTLAEFALTLPVTSLGDDVRSLVMTETGAVAPRP